MRWPIRNQILLPLIAIQLIVVLGLSSLTAWWSLRRVERDLQRRLTELTATVAEAQFPLTEAVLKQLRGLSGAEFLVINQHGELLSSTLEVDPTPEFLRSWTDHPGNKGSEGHVFWQGREYLARSVNSPQGASSWQVAVLYPAELVESARRDALLGPVILGGCSLLLISLAVPLVAQRIGGRMQEIERHVARVAGGEFSEIPLPWRDDELRDLTLSVNRMSLDLLRLTRQIRETERGQLIKQLAGGIAHQLRNALTGARLAVQLHRRRCDRPGDESLDVALRQLALTEEQIRGLVALIRNEQRPRVAGHLDGIAEEVRSLLRPVCDHRHIAMTLEGSAGDAEVADSEQMRAALLNLCMNGIEATGAGGALHVQLSRLDGQRVQIEVLDDGPGAPPEIRDSMFEAFQTTKGDGMGLGLALVRQAAEDHAGEIVYERREHHSVFRLICRCLCPPQKMLEPIGDPPPTA